MTRRPTRPISAYPCLALGPSLSLPFWGGLSFDRSVGQAQRALCWLFYQNRRLSPFILSIFIGPCLTKGRHQGWWELARRCGKVEPREERVELSTSFPHPCLNLLLRQAESARSAWPRYDIIYFVTRTRCDASLKQKTLSSSLGRLNQI
jgi:hypothetical protein